MKLNYDDIKIEFVEGPPVNFYKLFAEMVSTKYSLEELEAILNNKEETN